jgi:hypothetical protein
MTDVTEIQDTEYQRAYRRARRQVRRLRGWYLHAFIFSVIVGFAWLRYFFGPTFLEWGGYHHLHGMPLKMTLGWGFAVLVHGFFVWGRFGPLGHEWEDRQIKKYMEQSNGSSSSLRSGGDRGKP